MLLNDVDLLGEDFPFDSVPMQTFLRPGGPVCEPKDLKAVHDKHLEELGLEAVGVPVPEPSKPLSLGEKQAQLKALKTQATALEEDIKKSLAAEKSAGKQTAGAK